MPLSFSWRSKPLRGNNSAETEKQGWDLMRPLRVIRQRTGCTGRALPPCSPPPRAGRLQRASPMQDEDSDHAASVTARCA